MSTTTTPVASIAGSDARLVHVLDEYLAALQRGEQPESSMLLADHPDLAEDLRACLASLEFYHRAAVRPVQPTPMPTQWMGSWPRIAVSWATSGSSPGQSVAVAWESSTRRTDTLGPPRRPQNPALRRRPRFAALATIQGRGPSCGTPAPHAHRPRLHGWRGPSSALLRDAVHRRPDRLK